MGVTVDFSKCKEVVPGVFQRVDNADTYYIKCTIKGTLHYCNGVRMEKLVKKAGSLEKVGSTYQSREGKQDTKPAPVVTPEAAEKIRIKAEESVTGRVYLERPPVQWHPKVDKEMGQQFSNEWTQCLRPNTFINNGGYCNGCKWFDLCKYEDREWQSYEGQSARFELVQKQRATLPRFDVLTENESVEVFQDIQRRRQNRLGITS